METINNIEKFSLGRRQLNKITDIMAGTMLIDTNERVTLSKQEIIKALGSFSYADTAFNSSNTNIHRPDIINELIGKDSRKINYINGIGNGDDILQLVDTASKACNIEKTPITFRMIYGATEQASLRALSYPLPALSMIKNIADKPGVNPNLQIVFANNISGELNNLDNNKVFAESSQIISGLNYITEEMGIKDRVGFYYDDPNIDINNLDYIAKEFAGIAPEQLLHTLNGKGDNSNLENTCRYAAAHYMVHDNPDTKLDYIEGFKTPESANIIDIGGIQERFYRAVRLLIAKVVDIQLDTAQIYTKHHVPPYYMAHGGDISLSDFAQGKDMSESIAAAAKPDLTYLNNIIDVSRLKKETYND